MRKITTPRERASEIDPRNFPPGTKIWMYVRQLPDDSQPVETQEEEMVNLAKSKGWILPRPPFRDRATQSKVRIIVKALNK